MNCKRARSQLIWFQFANHHTRHVCVCTINLASHIERERKRESEWVKKIEAHLLLILLVAGRETACQPIDANDNSRRAPSEGNQPFDQLFLWNECGHKHCMQIETLAQHPRIVGQQKIVQYYVKCHTIALLEITIPHMIIVAFETSYFCLLTGLFCTISALAITTRYQMSHNELLAANELNKCMCSVMRAHFKDLQIKFMKYFYI